MRALEETRLTNPLKNIDYILEQDPPPQRFNLQNERQFSEYPWNEERDDDYFDRVAKGNEEAAIQQQMLDDYADSITNPMTRDQEFLQHSSLWGHQIIQGGAGEGDQILKPDGSQKNSQEMKTDAVLPAYCDPPNPCPVGYTGADGCLEDFENTAAFSREYQEAQDCLCDAEHMFGCGESRGSEDIGTPGNGNTEDEDDALNSILANYKIIGQHKTLVAKKFHTKKSENFRKIHDESVRERAKKAAANNAKNPLQRANEFLSGEKLPIAAKKGAKLA